LINANKQSVTNGYLLNTTLEFSCLNGYTLVGSKINLCVSNFTNGYWKGGTALCLPISTISPTTTITTDATTIKSQTDYSLSMYTCKLDLASTLVSFQDTTMSTLCMDNYKFLNASFGSYLSNNALVIYQCLNTNLEKFSAKCLNGTLYLQQNCNELIKTFKSCIPPPKIANGYNKFGSTQHGKKALYQCFNGYELVKGHSEIECINGEWVGAIPQCSKINCGFPGILNNGRILYIGTLSEYTYQPYMNTVGQNKQIRYECDKDYQLEGPSGSTCINGRWKPHVKLAKCVKELGSSKPEILNGPLQYQNDFELDEETLDEYIPTSKLLKQNIKLYETRHSKDNSESSKNNLYKNMTSSVQFNEKRFLRNSKLKRLKKHRIKKFKFDENSNMNVSLTKNLNKRRRKSYFLKYKNQGFKNKLNL
jgi:hypothetical protein